MKEVEVIDAKCNGSTPTSQGEPIDLKKLYTLILTQVLFPNHKPKLTTQRVSKLVDKLPSILFEWQYMEPLLKEHNFNFKPVEDISSLAIIPEA